MSSSLPGKKREYALISSSRTDSDSRKVLHTMRHKGRFYDAVIEVNGTEIPVHRDVLASRSTFFENAFQDNTKTVRIPDASMEAMSAIVDYAYGVDVFLKNGNHIDFVMEVMKLAHRFHLRALLEISAMQAAAAACAKDYVQLYRTLNVCALSKAKHAVFRKMAVGFGEMVECTAIAQLAFDDMRSLISSPDLIADEFELLKGIVEWSKAEKERGAKLEGLLSGVHMQRYDERHLDFLEEHHGILPKAFLIRALLDCARSSRLQHIHARLPAVAESRVSRAQLGMSNDDFKPRQVEIIVNNFRNMGDAHCYSKVFSLPLVLDTDALGKNEEIKMFHLNYSPLGISLSVFCKEEFICLNIVIERRLHDNQNRTLKDSVRDMILCCRTTLVSEDGTVHDRRFGLWNTLEICRQAETGGNSSTPKTVFKIAPVQTLQKNLDEVQCSDGKYSLLVWLQTAHREHILKKPQLIEID